jgi:hypothetical protein
MLQYEKIKGTEWRNIMKQAGIILLCLVLLSGCNLLQEVNSTLDYVNAVTEYLDVSSQFANDLPELINQATTQPEETEELEARLLAMKEEISAINELEPPGIASGIHERLVSYNQEIEEGIDSTLEQMETGEIDLSIIEDSKILSTIQQIQEIRTNLDNLLQ